MYAYSSSCQLRHFQLRHCIVNDVIRTGVACWSWHEHFGHLLFLEVQLPMYNFNWHRSFDLCKLVDARRRARCECFQSLTLVWLDTSTRAVWTGLYTWRASMGVDWRASALILDPRQRIRNYQGRRSLLRTSNHHFPFLSSPLILALPSPPLFFPSTSLLLLSTPIVFPSTFPSPFRLPSPNPARESD